MATAEVVPAVPDAPASPETPAAATGTPSSTKSVPSKNGYHYWHAHGRERAEVGDVAPKPTHVPLAVTPSDASSPASRDVVKELATYSWGDGKKVSVYVKAPFATADNTTVTYLPESVEVIVRTAPSEVHVFRKTLAQECDPAASTFRVDAQQQVVLKIAKAKEGTWFDLASKSA